MCIRDSILGVPEPSVAEVTGESTFVHFKFKVVSKKEQNHHDHDSYVLRVLDKIPTVGCIRLLVGGTRVGYVLRTPSVRSMQASTGLCRVPTVP